MMCLNLLAIAVNILSFILWPLAIGEYPITAIQCSWQ